MTTPLTECADPEAAVRYVAEVCAPANIGNTIHPRLAALTADLLMCLVHAAGLSGGTEADVLAWAEDADVEAPLTILRGHYGPGPASWPDRLRTYQVLDRRTTIAVRAELLRVLAA